MRGKDIWVESVRTTATGPANYPGNSTPSKNWPGFAPGIPAGSTRRRPATSASR